MEKELRERSAQLVAAEAAKDFEKALSFWTPDAVVHMEGGPAMKGPAAIGEVYRQFFAAVRSFTAEIESVSISSSGDMAYETGMNYVTVETPEGKTASTTNKYLAVWKKKDGQWYAAAVALTSVAGRAS